jgi:ubiquinone biosynthesis protein UbiJ
MASQVWENPVVKWVLSASQVLFITFICWLGSNIGSSVTAFSNKLDKVAQSIADIAARQVMQERDTLALTQRAGKLEGKVETLEQQVVRLGFKVEQLERESPHGRQ